jgi:uncharacterized repeat protein (TIGR03803 family)
VICDFGGNCLPLDGNPQTNMVRGSNGVLYGAGLTALFALQPPSQSGEAWTGSTIHNFDGAQPSGLAIGDDGVLYGATMQGGPCNYCGTIFRWAPQGR